MAKDRKEEQDGVLWDGGDGTTHRRQRPRDRRATPSRLRTWMTSRFLWTRTRDGNSRDGRGRRLAWLSGASGAAAVVVVAAVLWAVYGSPIGSGPGAGGPLPLGSSGATAGTAGAARGSAGGSAASEVGSGSSAGAGSKAGTGSEAGASEALAPLPATGPANWQAPLAGRVLQPFGWAHSAVFDDWRLHAGVDLNAVEGTNVASAAAGQVASVTTSRLWGKVVQIKCGGGWTAVYKGLGTVRVSVGERVTAGQTLGTVGAPPSAEGNETAHLHFEVEHNGTPEDPESLLSTPSR